MDKIPDRPPPSLHHHHRHSNHRSKDGNECISNVEPQKNEHAHRTRQPHNHVAEGDESVVTHSATGGSDGSGSWSDSGSGSFSE